MSFRQKCFWRKSIERKTKEKPIPRKSSQPSSPLHYILLKMPDTPDKSNDVDISSFASILAGAKRMREETRGDPGNTDRVTEASEVNQESSFTTTRQSIPQPPPPPPPPQDKLPEKEIANVSNKYQRYSLNESTAKPVTPFKREAVLRSTTPGSRVQGPNQILINPRQEKNPLLKTPRMTKIPYRFDSSFLSDFYISPVFQILYLSLKYHNLHPEYLGERWKLFNKGSTINDSSRTDKALRVLLVNIDIPSPQATLRQIQGFCMKVGLTVVLVWSLEDAGNYIAMAKSVDDAPTKARSIEGNKATDYHTCANEALTGIRLVNITDATNLLANCKSIKKIVLEGCKGDNSDGLSNIHGLGPKKLRALKDTFSDPFIINKASNE